MWKHQNVLYLSSYGLTKWSTILIFWVSHLWTPHRFAHFLPTYPPVRAMCVSGSVREAFWAPLGTKCDTSVDIDIYWSACLFWSTTLEIDRIVSSLRGADDILVNTDWNPDENLPASNQRLVHSAESFQPSRRLAVRRFSQPVFPLQSSHQPLELEGSSLAQRLPLKASQHNLFVVLGSFEAMTVYAVEEKFLSRLLV